MIKQTLILTALLASSGVAFADAEKGKTLHNANCIACHAKMTGGEGTTLYTRTKRRVNSTDALASQVKRCATNLNLTWFDDEINDVSAYLNKEFYKFPTK